MKIQEDLQDGICVISPYGRIDSVTSDTLDEKLQAILSQNTHKLLINFSNTDFISSAGLRVLLMAAKKAKAQSCKMRLCGLNDILKDIFDVSGFIALFAIDLTQEESLHKLQE